MYVHRTTFNRIKTFRDRFRFASGQLGPYTKVGPQSYVSGTAGQVSLAPNVVTRAIREPTRFHWPK